MSRVNRPQRRAAQKAMASFILSENEEDNSSKTESEHSDYLVPEESVESESSTISSGQNSSEECASSYEGGHSKRTDADGRGRSIPLISSILPPFGRVGFNSKISSKIAVEIFKDEVNYHLSLSNGQTHPFSFMAPKSGITESSLFFQRQRILYSLNSLIPVRENDIKMYMPESTKSPRMVFLEEQKSLKMPRFHFDQAQNILYTGGYVKCISWSPPFMDEEGVSLSFLPSYIAIASYPNNGTRVNFNDPTSSELGLIHVWSCSGLALTVNRSRPQLKPHFFLAHDWGHVMDMHWLPVPVQCANSSGVSSTTSLNMKPKQIAQLVGAVVGHLIAACTDGFVRIFLVPAVDNRFNLPDEFKLVIPTKVSADGMPKNVYQFKPKSLLRLAPDANIPSWLGWPNVLAIRSEFPHRLVVGYTSGHLALYNLSALNSHFVKIDDCLLKPVFLSHFIPGPFTSIALHPLYENIVVGLGLDREINVWDLEDPECVQCGLAELSWPIIRMGWGGHVVWPRAGDSLWVGRQEYLFPFAAKSVPGGAVTITTLKKPSDVPARMRAYTACFPTVSPIDCSRYCFDRGFEATTCLDYSDSFAFLVQGDANGQVNFHSWVLDPRRVMREKTRLAIQKKHRMYQWLMQKPNRACGVSTSRNVMEDHTVLDLNAIEGPFDEEIRRGCDLCGESGQILCWHKVEEHFEFVFREGVGLQRNKYDFVNSTFSSISKLVVSPNPGSASWLAVGTGFGVVQLICHEQFYHPDMDRVLRRSPPANEQPSKSSFFVSMSNVDSGSIHGNSDATVPSREDSH